MPKNRGALRAGVGLKKTPLVGRADAETDFIVFENADGSSKKNKKKEIDDVNHDSTASKEKEESQNVPQKPTARVLIGGSSWTGKLPVNMLSEHCQKQKWEKPEYTMRQSEEGFSSMVILKTKNTKTGDVTRLPPFKIPPDYLPLTVQPTAVEARHFAAAYALYRVASMRNLHMTMPPTYRDLWKGPFEDIKKADLNAGRAWMYEADPFVAKRERDQSQMVKEKQRKEADSQKFGEHGKSLNIGLQVDHAPIGHGTLMKVWSKAPKVEMGRRTRKNVESLVRQHGRWNLWDAHPSDAQKSGIVEDLSRLGFRKSHVAEATVICKDREEVLEWLLVHVPEDDLPPWALPEGYAPGVSMASSNLKRDSAVKRLAAGGYSTDLCEEVLDSHGGNESKAAEILQLRLLHGTDPGLDMPAELSSMSLNPEVSVLDEWEEEQAILASIYDERYERLSPDTCQVRLHANSGVEVPIQVHIRQPSTPYPRTLAILTVHAALPAYIRLSITRQALAYAEQALLGQPMIFNLMDWLEQDTASIIQNPGRLLDISTVASTASESQDSKSNLGLNQRNKGNRRPVVLRPGSEVSARMLAQWQARQSSAPQQRMLAIRQSLPAWQLQESIVSAVSTHQVVIVSGETGSGKSTQTVQFVLDDMIRRQLGEAANILCTQPRRISALGLADRVAEERCSKVGDEVGYSIRGESKQRRGLTKITFMTTGVLLRRLQTGGSGAEDMVAALADVTHVVVDEVHERSLDTDFLLVLLRDILRQRRDLKLILMSATLNADTFEAYFGGSTSVGRVHILGRTYPVEDYYLDQIIHMTGFQHRVETADDMEETPGFERSIAKAIQRVGFRINYGLISEVVKTVDKRLGNQDGGILIFLPGVAEIQNTLAMLRAIPGIYALPLHASMATAEQRRVFAPAPNGKRKVVASTNVAETSITIEDIVAVIDAGRVKETSFDPQNNLVKLEEVWASKAACQQRRGRAGRVRAGICYKLYTRNAESNMRERPEPEIRRVPLEQLCLSVKAMGITNVSEFLASALTPPDSTAVEGAMSLLGRMGALDGDRLTALGMHLSIIPADLRVGKLLLYGATFGCLDACLTIAAILTVRSPFVTYYAKRDQAKAARAAFGDGHGDLISDLRAYDQWQSMRNNLSSQDLRVWVDENLLSHQTLSDISSNRAQYLASLKEVGFIAFGDNSFANPLSIDKNRNDDVNLLRALIAGAFYPQMSRIGFPDKKFAASISGAVELDPEARKIKYFNERNERVFVHPGSTMFDAQGFPGNAVCMSYFSMLSTGKVFVRELTPFNAFTALLFCGSIGLDTMGRGLVIDGWLRFRGWARIGVLVSRLRMMLDEVLAKQVDEPGAGMGEVGIQVVDVVRRLIEWDGLDA